MVAVAFCWAVVVVVISWVCEFGPGDEVFIVPIGQNQSDLSKIKMFFIIIISFSVI